MSGDKPEFRAYTVNQYGKGAARTARWTEIGAAWRTQNDNLRVQLEATPVNGTIILIPPKDAKPDENDIENLE